MKQVILNQNTYHQEGQMHKQGILFSHTTTGEVPVLNFDGDTFSPELDGVRLSGQSKKVFDFMADSKWHTLAEISKGTSYPESSISARLRDYRKVRFGSHIIEKRRRYGISGTWEYQLIINK